MSRLHKWFYRHFDLVMNCRRWAVLLLIVISSGVAGAMFANFMTASYLAQQRQDQVAEVQRLQDINRQLMLLIQERLPVIAGTADNAAQTAREAADVAKGAPQAATGAGATARSASAKAQRAASTAEKAATTLNNALEPPAAPKEAPKWLDGP